jgi:uncharacterized protein
MRQKLNIITLGTDDLKKSAEFYEKGLGWKRSGKSVGDLILFPLGGITLALYPRKELAEDAFVENSEPGFSGVALSFNAKTEKEVEEVLSEAEKAGATITKPAQKVVWGGYAGYFKDTAGHLIEVAFNPFWDLDENDNLKL